MGFMIKKPSDVEGSALPAILIGLFVAFGGVLFGYDTGTIGGILAMPFWRKQFSTGHINEKDHLPDITSNQSSLIVSILSAGTFFVSHDESLLLYTWSNLNRVLSPLPPPETSSVEDWVWLFLSAFSLWV